MALGASLLGLVSATLFCLACAGLGWKILSLARLEPAADLESLLHAIAVGAVSYLAVVAATEFLVKPGVAVVTALVALLVAGGFGLRQALHAVRNVAQRIRNGSRTEHLLAALTVIIVLFEALAAVAPLTGSDALHYHFTAPQLNLRNGFAPDFSLVNSFFVGQAHLLILTGLALGSEQLALALIFSGGLLAAAAGACLARQWVSREWAWLCGLTFLLTPVIFWQATTSGAPDIWMCFFATIAVLTVARVGAEQTLGIVLLSGMLAGAVAGAKYTGCIVAASLALAFALESRSLRRVTGFVLAAIAGGVWPYLRNFLWTHDPVFPFLMRHLAPAHVNLYTLQAVRADTGAIGHRTLLQIVEFPLFAAIDQAHLGFWQFLGPLVLTFAPLLFLGIRKTPLWRTTLVVWWSAALAIGFASGMTRFLAPLLPMALAAVFAAVNSPRVVSWPWVRRLSIASIFALLLFCAGGLFIYGRAAVAAATGFTSREAYLQWHAPDYGRIAFVNQTLEGQGSEGNTLVFIRHLYYLRRPFIYGNPEENWEIEPERLSTLEAWRAWLRVRHVRWVVRAPDWPPELAATLRQLEIERDLVPVAAGNAVDFAGMRISGTRESSPITILRVRD